LLVSSCPTFDIFEHCSHLASRKPFPEYFLSTPFRDGRVSLIEAFSGNNRVGWCLLHTTTLQNLCVIATNSSKMSLSEQLQMLSSPQGIRMLMYSVHRKTKPVSNLAKVLVGVALPKVKKYGLPVAAIYLLLSHFGIKRKQNWTMIKSLSFALKSSTLWKMVLSSLAFTVAMKRLFGFASSKAFPAFFVTVWTMMYRYVMRLKMKRSLLLDF
jgi:hypothetical protein